MSRACLGRDGPAGGGAKGPAVAGRLEFCGGSPPVQARSGLVRAQSHRPSPISRARHLTDAVISRAHTNERVVVEIQ